MISKTGLHALKALAALGNLPKGEYVGAGALAKEIGAPQNYLGKLLQTLTREGLVQSQKGLGGGFRIAKDPKKTSLYDVIEPLEHVGRWTGCFLGKHRCSCNSPCAVHSKWEKARDAYLDFLKNTTLDELAKES